MRFVCAAFPFSSAGMSCPLRARCLRFSWSLFLGLESLPGNLGIYRSLSTTSSPLCADTSCKQAWAAPCGPGASGVPQNFNNHMNYKIISINNDNSNNNNNRCLHKSLERAWAGPCGPGASGPKHQAVDRFWWALSNNQAATAQMHLEGTEYRRVPTPLRSISLFSHSNPPRAAGRLITHSANLEPQITSL